MRKPRPHPRLVGGLRGTSREALRMKARCAAHRLLDRVRAGDESIEIERINWALLVTGDRQHKEAA
jgi:hypothetical protein